MKTFTRTLAFLTASILLMGPHLAISESREVAPLPKAPMKPLATVSRPFEASLIQRDAQGSVRFRGNVRVGSSSLRLDSAPGSANPFTMIVRKDRQVVWLLNPTDKTYVEFPFDEAAIERDLQQRNGSQQVRDVRRTRIAGQAATEQAVALAMNLAGGRVSRDQTAWKSASFNTWIAIRESDGVRTELQNIRSSRLGRFDLPPEFKKLETLPSSPSDNPADYPDGTAGKAIPQNLPRQPEIRRTGRAFPPRQRFLGR